MLRYLPNSLTLARLLLAVPLGMLVLQQQYQWALAVGLLAGLSDALDGFLARRLNAHSRVGAALDPIADKVLVTVAFLSFACSGLIPWYLAGAVILRDLVIVTGAACYHLLIGPLEFAATTLSKVNMFVQICFCALLLLAQVVTWVPPAALTLGTVAVLFIAGASGCDYVLKWSARAIAQRRQNP
ncbi:MAG: CDP-alcohol phosphatidyltransferase family protein [Pseudomonadales bacterium]|nr:CDP-alcohol phosphatidyltransferase family protein [Pseudomonadales bacterium]